MLAPDSITLHDGTALRPTLRAALRLHRKHGLPAVFRGVIDGRLEIIADVVAEGSGNPDGLASLLRDVGAHGARFVDQLRKPLVEFLRDLVTTEEPSTDKPAPKKAGKPGPTITRGEFYEGLFQFAVGNLGWTPDQAWNASPAEIVAAQKGRRDLLVSIFGTGEQGKPEPKGTLAQQASDAMAMLGAVKVKA